MRTFNRLRYGLAAVVLLFLLHPAVMAQTAAPTDTTKPTQDLFILGFGELILHSMTVDGNDTAFKSANPTLSDGFSSNYRASLFANGNAFSNFSINGAAVIDSRIDEEYQITDPSIFRLKLSTESTEPIWDTWRFTGYGLYDPARQWKLGNLDKRLLTQPQEPAKLEMLLRLESDEHGLVEAGSIRPSFKESQFTLHQRSLFGLYADLHTDKVGAEAVAGKLEGKAFREGTAVGIRANGTSGPFDLTKAPVTNGSEEVKIEVRDRFDESTVLESRTLIRDVDYEVDYLLGRVLLHQPVASETMTSDPVYIVITFDYIRDANDELYGGRAHVMPTDGLAVSGSILHRNIDANASGDGVAEPEDLLAGDASLKLGEHTTAYVEIAGSDNPNSTDSYSAVRVGATSEVIKDLTLNASFQRLDDQFRSFTNSDLDPTKNQQRLKLKADYDLTESQQLSASFANHRGLEANGQFNTYAGERNEDILSLGYKNQLLTSFGFGIRYERREVNDRVNALHEDTKRDRAVLDLAGKLNDFFIFGKFDYKGSIELDRFRNQISVGEPDRDKNQLAFSFVSKPSDKIQLEAGQRLSLQKNIIDDVYDERQDASMAKLRYLFSERLNTFTTWEYQRYTVPGNSVSFWQDDPTRSRWAGTFALEYLPLAKFKLLAKSGRQRSNAWITDSTGRAPSERSTTDFVLGQMTYFHTHHLSFNGETELRQTKLEYSQDTRNKIWDLGLRVNWNRDRLNEFTAGLIRRWRLNEATIGSEVTSSSYIVLLSGSISITREFYARASLKNILLNDPQDDSKTFTRIEAGYDSNSWYRVSLGYERIESDNDLTPDLDYTGQGLFIRLSGKL